MKKFMIVLLAIISIIILIIVGMILFWIFRPNIYTPPTLTLENLKVYNECIEFLRAHDDQKYVIWMKVREFDTKEGSVFYENRIFTGNVCQKLSDPSIGVKDKIAIIKRTKKNDVSDSLLSDYKNRMKEKSKRPYGINCMRFYRWNDFVMFYKHSPGLIDYYKGPGILYSLDGRNPNEIEDKVINAYKPFVKIRDNWYTSRHLMLKGPRHCLNHSSLPESLFDFSLKEKN